MAPRLQVLNATKHFGIVHALTDVSIDINDGEVVGLIGENGAGKSTLLKLLSGNQPPDSGRIVVGGEERNFGSVQAATSAGVSMVYQEQSLLPNISLAENIMLGIEGTAARFGTYSLRKMQRRAAHYLERVGLDLDPRTRTEELSFGTRQMVEIAKALAVSEFSGRPPILLLDEPTSVLERKEIEQLFKVVREMKSSTSFVFVSHRLEEVLEISDRIYVMRDGQVVADVHPHDQSVEQLFALMVGRDLTQSYFREELTNTPSSQERLVTKNLSGDGFTDVSISIKHGEIVSLLGLQGSGREEFARALFGAVPYKQGQIFFDGAPFSPRRTSSALRAGIGYVPSERKVDGVIMMMSVADNMTFAHPSLVSTSRIFSRRKVKAVVQHWIDRLQIKTPGGDTPIRSLSGGNQQKVVLAKWLMDPNLKLLIMDTPTRGIDVGAKTEIYALLRDLAAQGISILLLADSLEEGLFMAHRVYTMMDGKISGEFVSSPQSRPARTEVVERML